MGNPYPQIPGNVFVSAAGVIKSIQYFSVTGGATATIAAVDVAKTALQYLGQRTTTNTTTNFCTITLTNATTVTSTGVAGQTISGCAVEYY